MNAAEAWGIGVAVIAPLCFAAGFFASRSNRRAAEREEREWRERQR